MRKIRYFLLAAFLWFPAFLQADSGVHVKTFNRLRYYSLYDLMTLNRLQISTRLRTTAVTGFGNRVQLAAKSRKVIFNGVNFYQSELPEYFWFTPYISAADWRCLWRPLIFPGTVSRHPVRLVTIDMGHGGADPGAIGRISREKNITLAIGRKVEKRLLAAGIKVNMTRRRDVQIPLKQVDAIQRSSGSDLFISIHVNAAKNTALSGIETFCLSPAGTASSNGGKRDSQSFSGNAYDGHNILLAYSVHKALLRRTGCSDMGIKRARFAVLRDLKAPGILVEVGFISNPREEKKLVDPAYQETLAAAIVDGILKYRQIMRQ